MLACPICSEPLNAVDNGVVCPAGHRFDRARQGYLNLLPVQHKNSRDPGDNQAMVEARRDFLNAGHYAPVAKRLAELAAVGAAAIYVPFPHAVDDHQSTNARFVVDAGGGWVVQQTALSPEKLAHMIQNMQRSTLLETAQKAKMMQKTEATAAVVAACQELAP